MSSIPATSFELNGRHYHPPARPVVAICLDGSAVEYILAASSRGLMPHWQALARCGWMGLARAAMPTFTNVNNSSIVTGVTPAVHGIGGNFFFDRASGREVMMNSADFLRCPVIFPAAQKAGRKVAVITAKEKLRDIFSRGLIELGGIGFSSEKAAQARLETHGISDVEAIAGPTPQIYSGDASLYVLRAGRALLAAGRADFLYLSTTDFMQHKYTPESREALEFYAAIDRELGEFRQLGALIGVTADHGMNSKQNPDGSPRVIYLESVLNERFGPGFRVILPITDPYVVHHGALGSFAVIHLPEGFSGNRSAEVMDFLKSLEGVTEVYGTDAAERFELPADRLGDFAVASGRDVVLGRSPEYHDLQSIEGGLRSHGGRYEEMVPFLVGEPLSEAQLRRARGDLRNFDLFDLTCNAGR